jgi:hypothetical protein
MCTDEHKQHNYYNIVLKDIWAARPIPPQLIVPVLAIELVV